MKDEHEPRASARPGTAGRVVASDGEGGWVDARALIQVMDDLPVPILVRESDGALAAANAAARRGLRLDDDPPLRTNLTRIRRAGMDGLTVYLVTVDGDPHRRIEGLALPLGRSARSSLELIAFEWDEVAPATAASVPAEVPEPIRSFLLGLSDRRDATEPRPENARPRQAAGRRSMPARALLAEVLRRARRFAAADAECRVHSRRDGRLDHRVVLAAPVEVAQVVLNGLELLSGTPRTARADRIRLHAAIAGGRLRIALETTHDPSLTPSPNLLRHRALTRSIAPILRTHAATFEVHHGSNGSRRVILTLPTEPRAAEPGSSP